MPHLFRKINRYLALDSSGRTPTGDLEERYRIIRRKFGTRRAAFWYWTQAIRSVGPIAWLAIKKLTKAATGLATLVEMYRRIRF